MSSWPGTSDGSAGIVIECSTAGGFVGVSGGAVVLVDGGDDSGSDLFERMLKKERSMEDNVSFRVLKTFGVADVGSCSRREGSAATVAFALTSPSGSRDCFHCPSM